ncbi:MAG: serine/threonine protein kinase, partial [Planctomycetota bacterium]|nr:serine/threonine protein kinase [Planctomycetota bacterium]
MRRIGRYELLDEVARGGAGVVHRARAPGGPVVAVKILLAGAGAPPVARQRFLTEGRLLARLRHPGVLRVHEVGEEGGCQFLVMDLLEGASLQDRLDREGPFPPRAAAALVRDLARALQHVHEAGVLHRDVKPANALLDRTGAVVLTDFGLGKDLLAAGPGPSVTGQLLGSPGFWAPEQAAGDTRRMGPRTDVFGAGATLFALLTGSPPNRGEGLAELIEAMSRPPPPPS